MASERLQVILDMETGAYRREARRASDSTREIGTTADQTGGRLQKLETRFKGIGIAASAALGAAAVAFVGQSVKAASDLEESINAVQQTFEDAAETVLEFGETAAFSAGLSARAFNELVTPIGALLRNFGFTAQEAADQSLVLTQRAADLASVFNVDVSQALMAVQAALRGEGDPIERFGANVSAARVEAFALAEGLVETKGEIDDSVKVMGRLGLILQDTERFAGDFAETADGAANSTKTLRAEFENLQAALGEDLLSPLATGLGVLIDTLHTTRELFNAFFGGADKDINAAKLAVEELRRSIGAPLDTNSLASFLTLVKELEFEYEGLSDEQEEFRDGANELNDDLEITTEVLELLADAAGLTASDIDDLLNLSLEELADILGVTEDQAARLLPHLEDLRDVVQDRGFIEASKRAWETYAAQLGTTAGLTDDVTESNQELAASFLEVLNARRELQDPLFAAAQSQQRKSEARDALTEAQAGGDPAAIARAQLDFISATAEADIATEDFAANFKDSFGAVLESSELTRDDLLETLDVIELLNDLRPVDILVSSQSIDEINRSAATLIRNIEILRGVGPGPVAPIVDPRLGQPRGFAHGGYADANVPITVGEQGVELFVPSVSGHVIPNHQLGGLGGSTVINLGGISVTGSALSEDPARLARHIRREIDRELADLRGGTV